MKKKHYQLLYILHIRIIYIKYLLILKNQFSRHTDESKKHIEIKVRK